MSVLAFRHAPVALAGVCYGQLDVNTTRSATDAAAIVEPQLAGIAVARVRSSPLRRCSPARQSWEEAMSAAVRHLLAEGFQRM